MKREIVEPTTDENGRESHPAWGLIGASRVSTMGGPHGGAVLFDSDIAHQHYVVVKIQRADRDRHLGSDWIHPTHGLGIVEIAMSEAQWASFVSSMNAGNGVPCTIERTADDPWVPRFPYAPRLQESMAEVRGAADKAAAKVAEAFEVYAEKKNAANLRGLKFAIQNMPGNIAFAAKKLTEHSENVVQRARADIEAMVVQKARQVGLDPGDVQPLMLDQGDAEEGQMGGRS